MTVTVVAVVMGAGVPTVLAAENWDDHDRSGRYMARDIGRNYLNTVPKNGIIINFGDNDTFPLWYCQEVEGVRPDVRVMNSSYLGGEWYIDEMKLAANEADGVPFTIPSTKYSFVNDWVVVADVMDVLDTDQARKLRSERRRIENSEVYSIRYTDSAGRQQVVTGYYGDINDKITQAQATIEEYQPFIEQCVAEGDTSSDAFYDAYARYVMAFDLFDAIVGDERFMADYDTMEKYWKLNDSIAGATLYLEDAIRLFISDEPMTLVVNDGRMRILAEGEVIPRDERADDYRMVGHLKAKVDNFFDGLDADYILNVKRYAIPVDKDKVIASGLVEESDRERIVDEVYIDLAGKSVLTKDHLMMLDLFAHFDWERPLSFTQSHLMRDYGIVDYARFDGYSYTFVPILTRYKSGSEVGYLDADKLYPIFMGESAECEPLYFGNLADEDVLVDYFYRFNASAARQRENFARVATEYLRRGENEDVVRAEALLDRGLEVLPSQKIGYTHSNTQPYIRGYYTVASYYLMLATDELVEAVDKFNAMLDMNVTVEHDGDDFLYFYNLSDAAAELQSTAIHRGVDVSSVDENLLLSDELFARAEECYRKGDVLAAEYIKNRGEWVRYYLQFARYDSFSTIISEELYNAMLDIIETLDTSHILAGSFDWVANGDTERPLVDAPLIFDELVVSYLNAVKRLTPSSIDDPQMALMEGHICNLYEIYSALPPTRFLGGVDSEAPYLADMERFLSGDAQYEILQIYGKLK